MKDNKDTVSTAIIIVVGVVVAAILALWIYNSVREEKEAGDQALAQVAQMNNALLESQFTIYDGVQIKGSQVINAIRNFESQDTQINVVVNNGSGETNYCYQSDLKTKIDSTNSSTNMKIYNDKSDMSTYINPSANFSGVVVRDEKTNTIVGIKFTLISNATP